MEFKHLASFEAVARLGSFSRAAGELFISQPTISLHVQQLEEELHTRLLIRNTRSVDLTPKGREVYEHAVSILSLRDRLIEEGSTESRRVIHIGASTIPSAYILPEVLPSYVAARPETYFVIEQGDSAQIVQQLTDGLIDVGLVGMPPENEALTALPFYEDAVVLITPVSDHFLEMKNAGASSFEDFLEEPFILREEGSGTKKAVDRFLADEGISESDLNVIARLNDPEAIKNMVAGGIGISLISDKAAQNYCRENRLLAFRFPVGASARRLYVIYRKSFTLRTCAEDFVKYLVKFYGNK